MTTEMLNILARDLILVETDLEIVLPEGSFFQFKQFYFFLFKCCYEGTPNDPSLLGLGKANTSLVCPYVSPPNLDIGFNCSVSHTPCSASYTWLFTCVATTRHIMIVDVTLPSEFVMGCVASKVHSMATAHSEMRGTSTCVPGKVVNPVNGISSTDGS